MIRLVIFDLDQTLINTLPRFYKIFNMSLKHFGGREIDWNTFMVDYAEDVLNRHIPAEPQKFWNYFLSHYNDIECVKDEPIKGALEVLRYLKEHRLYVVITTGRMVSSKEVWKELKRFEMDTYIDFVYTRLDEYGDGRRRTELIKNAMRKYKVAPTETMLVADYWPDMQSGRAAGVFTVGVLTGLESEEKLMENGADVVIFSVKELPSLIKERI